FRAFRHLHHEPTSQAITLERRILSLLGGGCGLPLGAWARAEGSSLQVTATFQVGGRLARVTRNGSALEALAKDVTTDLLEQGKLTAPVRPRGTRLAGKRVLVAMDADRAAPYVEAAQAEGAQAAAWSPTVQDPLVTSPAEIPLHVAEGWKRAAWALVASSRAVPALALLQEAHPNLEARMGAVGPATARALRDHGFPVHLVSPDGTGGGLGRLLAAKWPPKGPVLLPQAEAPTPDLADALRAAGIETIPWAVYRTRTQDPIPAPPLAAPVDVLLVASPSAVRALAGRKPETVAATWVALGPTTADALRAHGFPVHAVAPRRTPQAFLDVIP
ncbi:MAG TPA: uroporphyrinogen-III synthase, partial [Candidatus Thermoplasmatota archaeon]|nr:uroporphyrinogen-III synthase [Candidatus Thermoplasmatota archaeon]